MPPAERRRERAPARSVASASASRVVAVDIGLAVSACVRSRACHASPTRRTPADGRLDALAAHQATGARELGFERVGDRRTPSSATRKRACSTGSPRAATATWIIWRATARAARAPAELVPGTLRVITARMNYRPPRRATRGEVLGEPDARLRLALRARPRLPQGAARASCRRSPTASPRELGRVRLPRVHRQRAGDGSRARARRRASAGAASTRCCCRATRARSSSWARSTPTCRLPATRRSTEHCGTCRALHRRLPDAGDRRALPARRAPLHLATSRSSITGAIPEALRPLIGNRIYGCDDCQLVCPWNRTRRRPRDPDFAVRNGLDAATLVELFAWTRGGVRRAPRGQRDPAHRLRALAAQHRGRRSATRRHRNRRRARSARRRSVAAVREHVAWALARHGRRVGGLEADQVSGSAGSSTRSAA